MKFNINAGDHPAQVTIDPDGAGAFTGTITHTEFGDGQITKGVQSGNHLSGTVTLDGHEADFDATITGSLISGRVSLNWLLGTDFSGTQVA